MGHVLIDNDNFIRKSFSIGNGEKMKKTNLDRAFGALYYIDFAGYINDILGLVYKLVSL